MDVTQYLFSPTGGTARAAGFLAAALAGSLGAAALWARLGRGSLRDGSAVRLANEAQETPETAPASSQASPSASGSSSAPSQSSSAASSQETSAEAEG